MKSRSVIIIALLVATIFNGLKAQSDIDAVKAIYIYNFLSHIVWPDDQQSKELIIGVYGNSKTYGHLINYTANRFVGTKPVRIYNINSPSQLKKCQVVFIAEDKSSEMSKIKNIVSNCPCLLVSEKDGMINKGSAIDFVVQNNKLAYRLSEANAREQKLIISQKLVNLSL